MEISRADKLRMGTEQETGPGGRPSEEQEDGGRTGSGQSDT